MQNVTENTSNQTAHPRLIDTGSSFATSKICTYCLQPIEQKARKWVHSHNDSIYCRPRGD